MRWSSLNFGDPSSAVSALDRAIKTSMNIVTAYETFMSFSAGAMKLSATSRNTSNIRASAIDVSIDAALKLLPSGVFNLRGQASARVLNIPIVNPYQGVPTPPTIPGDALENIFLSAFLEGPPAGTEGSGGNYGIYKKIVESIFDERDPSRPILKDGKYAGVLTLVYGADDYLAALALARKLGNLLGDVVILPPDAHSLPIPQNVKLRTVANTELVTDDSPFTIDLASSVGFSNPFSIKVVLPKVDTRSRLNRRDPILLHIVAYHVFVKEGSPIRAGEDLKKYERMSIPLPRAPSLPGATSTHIPDDVTVTGLNPDLTYYISVGYTVEAVDEVGASRDPVLFEPEVSSLGDQMRVRLRERVSPTAFTSGTPPDWSTLQSPEFILPPLRVAFEGLTSTLASFRMNLGGGGYKNEYAAMLEVAEVKREKFSTNLSDLASEITNFTSSLRDLPGVWATTFEGTGGKAQFLQSMAQLFLGSRTQNKPPFSRGTEVAGALVFLVEGTASADAQAFLRALKVLLGATDVDTPNQEAENATGAAEILDVITTFDPGTLLTPETTEVPPVTWDSLGLGEEPDVVDSPTLHDLGIDDEPC